MRFIVCWTLVSCFLLLMPQRAWSHQEPTSFLDLRADQGNLQLSIVASTADLAHELEQIEPAMLLEPTVLKTQASSLAQRLLSRLKITADGELLSPSLLSANAITASQDVRFEFEIGAVKSQTEIAITCQLFPSDPRHRTYLNVYQGKKLEHQKVFEGTTTHQSFSLQTRQGLWPILKEFSAEGVHHIFIGPDHILFIIGLLLLGGSFGQMLRIISAFTVAHSITLGLATFHILAPPAAFIEPVIALSIVVVGFHASLGNRQRDPRLLFAFVFGLIHGFGFATVLQEMELPRHALVVSLVAFNLGVEMGQVCIVLAIVPALTYLAKKRPLTAARFTQFAALMISFAGAFWFFQRVL